MLKEFFATRALRAAAREYVARLGPQLQRDYGFSEGYTSRQIEESVRRARLPLKYIRLGFAGFLPERAFAELKIAPSDTSYRELRELLNRLRCKRATSGGFEPLGEIQYAVGAAEFMPYSAQGL